MAYQSPYNNQYPHPYAQQSPQHQQQQQPHLQSPQSGYNANHGGDLYAQYGKPMPYPQVMIPAHPGFAQPPQHQQPPTYVNAPPTTYQPSPQQQPMLAAAPPHFVHAGPSHLPPSQYGGHAPIHSPSPVTSGYYPISTRTEAFPPQFASQIQAQFTPQPQVQPPVQTPAQPQLQPRQISQSNSPLISQTPPQPQPQPLPQPLPQQDRPAPQYPHPQVQIVARQSPIMPKAKKEAPRARNDISQVKREPHQIKKDPPQARKDPRHVKNEPQQAPRSVSPVKKQQPTPQPKLKQLPSPQQLQQQQQRPREHTKPPVDYQLLLLSLADEYLDAAHSQGTMVALTRREMDLEEYFKLVATSLGCLEAVLKNWRLMPRVEALVRLRYARILYEETENNLEAETALSKGIDLCERNRMLDLKYSMQQLSGRMLYKSNPKAAMKAVDGMIQDVEAYRHVAWEYAFRLLRVTLSLSSSSHQDFVSAIHHLQRISALARRNDDRVIFVVASAVEALAHLQQSSAADSLEQAHRALATARSLQLDNSVRHIPQISTLLQIIDISCSLLEYDVGFASEKLQALQKLMDTNLNNPHWRDDGSFHVPINSKNAGPSSTDSGDILQLENDSLVLTLNWLPERDLYALCYFLSSVTLSAKNPHDGRKAEKYLQEGLRMVKGSFKTPVVVTESLFFAEGRLGWRRILYCNLQLQLIFLACSRTDWDLAGNALRDLRDATAEIGDSLPEDLRCMLEYASGIICQGTGDLNSALQIFSGPVFALSTSVSRTARNDPRRDTAVLAALNRVLILRDPSHPYHGQLGNILAIAEHFAHSSPNKYIQAAYDLVCATVQTDSTIQTKQHLQQALQTATVISNSQITCITLTFMSWKYFRGVVGEQSEKSAKAGRAMAKKASDRLWLTVTDEMLAETLDRQGKSVEAQSVREEADRFLAGLPPALKR